MSGPAKTGEVNFDISYSPDPLVVNTTVSIDDTKLQVTVDNVPSLSVTLKPKFSWNPVNDVLTCIASVANAFKSDIADDIKDGVKGIKVDLYTLSPVTLDASGINLTITPSNLTLENSNGLLMVSGDIDVSGL